MAVTTSASVDPEVQLYFDNILQDRYQPNYVFRLFGQERDIPAKNSKNAIFRRYDNLTDATAVLGEATPPTPETVTKHDVAATVNPYGKVVVLSDDVLLLTQDRTANEVADMLTQNMHSTYDVLIRNLLITSTSQFDCVSGNNGKTITNISANDIEKVVDFLQLNNTLKFTPIVESSDGFNTHAQYAAYWGIIHTALRSDLKGLPNFVACKDYGRLDSLLQAEYCSTDEVRWVTTTQAYSATVGGDLVYYNPIVGQNAYGCITIDEMSAEFIIKPLGFGGTDYLNQMQSMGWKGRFGCVILDDKKMGILRATKA